MRFRYSVYHGLVLGCLASGCSAPSRGLDLFRKPAPYAATPAPSMVGLHSASKLESIRQATSQSDIQLVDHQEPDQPIEALPLPSGIPVIAGLPSETFSIDLATAFRLANADNVQIAFAQEQVQQAYTESRQADVLWLPSLRGGVHWNKHEGPLLDTNGNLQDINRSSLYTGLGANAVGAGSPAIPGVMASFHLADALFQPLAARQRAGARESAATATRNNSLLDVAQAYIDLMRTASDVAIVEDVYDKTLELSKLTDAYARTGQGLQADADRMRVERGLRENEIRRSKEAMVSASARLAQLLRLEPCVQLIPAEPCVVQLCLVSKECDCQELVVAALSNRPELLQNRYLVGEAIERLKRERYASLVPSVVLAASYGEFGGGQRSSLRGFDDRLDLDATAFWEIRNLGLGDSLARQNASSRIRQTQIQELGVMDQVAREVIEAFTQVQLREQQIETAREIVKYAVDSYEHNVARIRAAQGLPIETLQSTQALLQARREYLRAISDFNSAQFTLQRALGWPVG